MKKVYFLITAGLIGLLYSTCKEDTRLNLIDDSAPAPGAVSGVSVKNIPGGAVLQYKIPTDKNMLYVKAVYTTNRGVVRESRASYYVDTLLIEGYGASGSYPVTLYAVGKNEKISEPLTVLVEPLPPAVELSFPDLEVNETFGGVRISFKNEYEANLAISLMYDSLKNGMWRPLQTFYTKSRTGSFSYLGLDSLDARFGIYLRDRWDNKSDTLIKELTPLYEERLQKPYIEYNLASDTYLPVEGSQNYALPQIWDDITSSVNNDIFATPHTSPIPQTFTFRLNDPAIISRIRVHHRQNSEYAGANVKRFQLYGSNAAVPGDDLAGGDWTLLGEFESFKPSGPGGAVTPEDKEYANVQGENFELVVTDKVPNPWIPVRYIRFRSMETWAGNTTTGQVIIAEITLSGQVQK
ncbi:DUF4959 domain-containing protein [Parapedobacter tibetensis]|uniref:DUF4959 domain-containing protein n=1 Tax=Parapedobacter tibetensis TaxID=2972951 RepID=UPI00214D4D57|nr:DUF4959 domain-containing protein [Parapedobacter tibetensis]